MQVLRAASNDDRVQRFAAAAKAYLDFIDGICVQYTDELFQIHKLVAVLQSLVVELISPSGEDEAIVSRVEGGPTYMEITAKLEVLPVKHYTKIFNPLAPEEPVVTTLQDDLADIYCDLARGLSLLQAGRPLDAEWDWRFSYYTHWGRHATSAQTAIWEFLAETM